MKCERYKKIIICKGLFFCFHGQMIMTEAGCKSGVCEEKKRNYWQKKKKERKVERKSSCSVIEDRNSWSF